jgi:hypothetical protein
MKINGSSYKLSKRKAGDILALINYSSTIDLPTDIKAEELSPEQIINHISVMAQTISDSLKATYMNLEKVNWFMKLINNFRKKKYRIFFDGQGASYLLENCDSDTLRIAYEEVLELDNIKKKADLKKGNLSVMELEKVS